MLDWTRCRSAARPIALAVALVAATPGWGQVPFLVPDRYVAAVGEELRLSLRSGEPVAAPMPWPGVKWFFVRVAGTQENRGGDEVGAGDGGVLSWPVAHAGVTMAGVDFAPVVETMPGDRLARLLADQSVDAPADLASRESVRVRSVRSVKTLITARATGAPTPDAATAVSKSGQAVEIRPLFDPTTTPVGSDLPLRMYIDGESFGTPRIVATHGPSGATTILGDGARSTLDLRITEPGAWRVEFRHASALTGDPEADWVLYTATLTFEAPAAGEAGR